jgi:hypothetical protein
MQGGSQPDTRTLLRTGTVTGASVGVVVERV